MLQRIDRLSSAPQGLLNICAKCARRTNDTSPRSYRKIITGLAQTADEEKFGTKPYDMQSPRAPLQVRGRFGIPQRADQTG